MPLLALVDFWGFVAAATASLHIVICYCFSLWAAPADNP